jgi:hypothetical protein
MECDVQERLQSAEFIAPELGHRKDLGIAAMAYCKAETNCNALLDRCIMRHLYNPENPNVVLMHPVDAKQVTQIEVPHDGLHPR